MFPNDTKSPSTLVNATERNKDADPFCLDKSDNGLVSSGTSHTDDDSSVLVDDDDDTEVANNLNGE